MTSPIDSRNSSSNPYLPAYDSAESPALMTCEHTSRSPASNPVTLFYEPSQDPAVSTLTSKYSPNYSAFIECQSSVDAVSSEPISSSTSRSDECKVDADQTEAGETASVPADFSVTVRRFAPYPTFGGGFEGDAGSRGIPEAQQGKGGFTTDESVTSRVKTSVAVSGEQYASTSESSPSSHHYLGEGRATPSTHDKSYSTSEVDGHLDVASAGGNPLTPGMLTPDIDTRLQADYLFQDKSLTLQGEVTGDDFPNAEVYVTDRVGNSILLDTFQTDGGRDLGPLIHLPGTGEESLASFNTQVPLNADGTFRMTCE